MAGEKSIHAGVRYGLIASLTYVVLLFLQFRYGASNPTLFAMYKFVTYLVILSIFFMAGTARRKELGGYIEFRDVFQTIFIAIIITEVVYAVFTYIYLKYVDPNFFEVLVENTSKYMERMGIPDEEIDNKLQEMEDSAAKKPTLGNALAGIGMWIIIDSIFALIFSAIIKRPKPTFPTT